MQARSPGPAVAAAAAGRLLAACMSQMYQTAAAVSVHSHEAISGACAAIYCDRVCPAQVGATAAAKANIKFMSLLSLQRTFHSDSHYAKCPSMPSQFSLPMTAPCCRQPPAGCTLNSFRAHCTGAGARCPRLSSCKRRFGLPASFDRELGEQCSSLPSSPCHWWLAASSGRSARFPAATRVTACGAACQPPASRLPPTCQLATLNSPCLTTACRLAGASRCGSGLVCGTGDADSGAH